MRVGIPGDHRNILNDQRTFRILEHFLEVGEYDPFYNPLNDYIVLPSKAEIEEHRKECIVVPSLDCWETISEDSEDYGQGRDQEYVATVSTGPTSLDTRAEAHAHVHLHGPHEGGIKEDHIEVEVIGIAEGVDEKEAAAALEKAIGAASDEAVRGNTRGWDRLQKLCHLKL